MFRLSGIGAQLGGFVQSAKDVEAMVATPGEQVLSQIAGVEHIMSVSQPESSG